MFYDDKTKGVLSVGRMLFIPEVDDEEDIVLKASFLVAGDLKCSSKVSALFDVVVLGDIECADLDVKGKQHLNLRMGLIHNFRFQGISF